MKYPALLTLLCLLVSISSAQNLIINEVMSANGRSLADEDDDYPDWIEITNSGSSALDLTGYGLSDNPDQPFQWIFPPLLLNPGQYVVVFASGKDRSGQFLHANFKIKSDGETLLLTDPQGNPVDEIETGDIPLDITRGRASGGGSELYYFPVPSPREANPSTGFLTISPPADFSLPGGLYAGSLSLILSTTATDADIRYTTDSSTPDENSPLYSDPIPIGATTVIKARVFESGSLPGRTVTQSYIFYDNQGLPVLSLSTDPENLFGDAYGIYALGPEPGPPPTYPHANFWQDWERPALLEMYEPDGSPAFQTPSGIRIHGEKSRLLPQKSFSVYLRDKYGEENIEYPVFTDLEVHEFEALVLRNSGQDWYSTLFRDAFMTALVADAGIDVQAYRPAILFLNGEYWGIYNIREKINEEFLASHHGYEPEEIDLLEKAGEVIAGDNLHYQAMLDYLATHDIRLEENYQYVATQMDIGNYINYLASEIYFANTDWPENNIKFWRPQTADGMWRWILFDTDYGFGLINDHRHNTLAYATDPSLHPDWSVYLFNELWRNETFRFRFINQFADMININFSPEIVVPRIDDFADVIEAEVPQHEARWQNPLDRWYEGLDTLRAFALNRPENMRSFIQDFFHLQGRANLQLDVSSVESGRIQVNSKLIPNYPWEGDYFLGVPVELTARPQRGYRFHHWEGTFPSDTSFIKVDLTGNESIAAIFVPDSTPLPDIVITEINYNSADEVDPEDWVELYNPTDIDIDLQNWIFKDGDDLHRFEFTEHIILRSQDLMVLCRDTSDFREVFPEVTAVMGDFDFGLSGDGEAIRLYDEEGFLIDSVYYDDEGLWPPEADGDGYTLELIDPGLPNELPGSWRASDALYGSPGQLTIIAGVSADLAALPRETRLLPAFPNPFNPTTVIGFELRTASVVNLAVYDIGGRKVAELVEGWRQAGRHNVTWDAAHLASGIYLYRLEANEFNVNGKMVLVK